MGSGDSKRETALLYTGWMEFKNLSIKVFLDKAGMAIFSTKQNEPKALFTRAKVDVDGFRQA